MIVDVRPGLVVDLREFLFIAYTRPSASFLVCSLRRRHSADTGFSGLEMLEGMPPSMSPLQVAEDVNIKEIACRTELFSGSDLHQLCREACMNPLRRVIENLSLEEIKKKRSEGALDEVRIRTWGVSRTLGSMSSPAQPTCASEHRTAASDYVCSVSDALAPAGSEPSDHGRLRTGAGKSQSINQFRRDPEVFGMECTVRKRIGVSPVSRQSPAFSGAHLTTVTQADRRI